MDAAETILEALTPKPRGLVYCDFIADQIKRYLLQGDWQHILVSVGPVKMDLHPTEGWFVSTKKTIEVTDRNGRKYRVTVEEA